MTTFEAFEHISDRNHCTILMHGNFKNAEEEFQMRCLMSGCESHAVDMLKMVIEQPRFMEMLKVALNEAGYTVLHESDIAKN